MYDWTECVVFLVIQFAKKTGDYSVLSHADLCVLALTLALDTREKERKEKEEAERAEAAEASHVQDASENKEQSTAPTTEQQDESVHEEPNAPNDAPQDILAEEPPHLSSEDKHSDDDAEREPLDVVLEPIADSANAPFSVDAKQDTSTAAPLFDDPSDEDDGEGEWITPDNVEMYKSRALELFPTPDRSEAFTTVSAKKRQGRRRRKELNEIPDTAAEQIAVGCMTADFAMQNVLLQMNLNLVGVEGRRIDKVKTWVLRCHACFK